ncbi:type II secretion system F family protein [Flagellatimonas centrodinii]|uniref:type II secretion system F family protein n=1 Tax=Flagellatimonas centrodinii TaxID=2806210 RepID=UPI001FEE1295|nr:type II secretion system F family protein [Flagellatimonas centrodinii]ULQ47139.1 type II secretion system F family protein [Flagellatimonas centrodinii]
MSPPTLLALLAAAGTATLCYLGARTLREGWADYRSTFQNRAERNLSQLFLFIDPQRLFRLHATALLGLLLMVMTLGGGWLLAVLLTVAAGLSPPLVFTLMRRRRRRQVVAQLPDALMGVATSMRAGLSLNQALETVLAYEPAPLSQELALMLRELRVGLAFAEAADNLHRRIPEVEVQLVTAAMKVSREVGGNLAETLERIADTLRKRLQMEGKIRSLTAQGKLQGLVMTALPIFLVLALTQLEPEAMAFLLHSLHGWATLAAIAVMEIVGYHFIRKIVNIDV